MSERTEPWPPGTPCWVDYAADDVEAARSFYADVLGWSYAGGEEEYGGYLMCQVRGLDVAGMGPKQDPSGPTAWTLYFATDDVDATAAAVAQAGGTVLAPPFDVGPMGRMAVAVDPAGAAFGLWQHGLHKGASVVNEQGALIWEDGRLGDPDGAREFYASVLGWAYPPLEGAPPGYTLFGPGGGPQDAPWGGIGPDMGSGLPSHWLPYFGVADTAAVLQRVRSGGGEVLEGPDDSPFGVIAVARDPWGAVFAVISTPEGGDRQG